MHSSSSFLTLVSKCTVFPDQKSTIRDLKLSVSDLPMLSCHYIQKGCLFTRPSLPFDSLIPLLKSALSRALTLFPPLAGRLKTDSDGYVYVTCNDAGVEFLHANASGLFIRDVLSPSDLPDCIREFFALHRTVSYSGHSRPIMAVQVTELADGVFIGCAVNHAVTDGTSFWNFFNTFAQVLQLPEGGPEVTFNADEPLRQRIFSFSREAILKLKATTNNHKWVDNGADIDTVELFGKQSNDPYQSNNWFENAISKTQLVETVEISSFQSLCALLWRSVTRARKLSSMKTTTFRMAVNCRHRTEPKLDPYYFGNAIQSIPTCASAGDVLSRDLRWCAEQLNNNVKAHDDATVRRFVGNWESNPRCFPLGNFDGASITMGSSPRFPMYDNDFGWGRPLAVRSGGANKFDGKISAFPGRDGSGTVDLEVVLAPETMAFLESDSEFMQCVSI
ncbi:HXXXD-type acyl-transferase family protein [Quillaja saponaria]|uniref:HXXXD-type acyl-transferase family protein n=1 Tax=Quillaja saponaria TaxID=32244 RepID=A0AAD7LTG2_QUISA|nr:HXXXD-type acyl-transferase family protein [Quillaja saponaria]